MKEDKEKLFKEVLLEICSNSRILESDKYIQHGDTSTLVHSIAVAYFSYQMSAAFRISVNDRNLIRGALLHDYYLYDWHDHQPQYRGHGYKHAAIALKNATRDLNLNEVERDIISKHMFPLNLRLPRYRESTLVCIADKICSIYEIFYMSKLFHPRSYNFQVDSISKFTG